MPSFTGKSATRCWPARCKPKRLLPLKEPNENPRIMIEPGTELKVTGLSRGKRFDLGVGKLEASVARQRPFRPLVVTTVQAEARVVGTRFTLAVTTNATRLEVTQGKVKLTRK